MEMRELRRDNHMMRCAMVDLYKPDVISPNISGLIKKLWPKNGFWIKPNGHFIGSHA